MASDRQLLVAHASPLMPTRDIRSTVLQSSVSFLRQRGHFARYHELLDPTYRAMVVESLAPSWLPIAAGLAHYAACDALALDTAEQQALGHGVGDRIQGTFLTTLVKTTRVVGVNPLRILPRLDRVYARLFQGGSVQVVQTGPKDAEIELCSTQVMRYAYCRTAFVGMLHAGFRFAGLRAAYVRVSPYKEDADRLVVRLAWV